MKRAFVDLAEGQVHVRLGGRGPGAPLVMLHPSPTSSKVLEPLAIALGGGRRVIAPDTLGNGDSAAPAVAAPEIPYYAAATLRVLDALNIGQFDLYGTHTGGATAVEIAVSAPDRVRRLILDGVSLYTPEFQQELLQRYALPITPDLEGAYLLRAWHFMRDQWIFWPWFKRDAAHRRAVDFPSPDGLHDSFLEVFKAIRTYHLAYQAAFRYPKAERLPLITVPTLVTCPVNDIFYPEHPQVARLVPGAVSRDNPGTETPAGLAATAAIFSEFLDG